MDLFLKCHLKLHIDITLQVEEGRNQITQEKNFAKTTLLLYSHTHTHSFNGLLSGTTQESRYQKGKN